MSGIYTGKNRIPEYSVESLGIKGYLGQFTKPEEESLFFEGGLFSSHAAPHPGVVKFQGIVQIPPFVHFHKGTDENSFQVEGPWFSLLYETAKKINYSMVGIPLIEGPDPHDMWTSVMNFRPDMAFAPFMASVDTCIEAKDMEFISTSTNVFEYELDHIMSKKDFYHPNFLAMITPFDFTSLILMTIANLITALIARYYAKTEATKKWSFQEIIWYFLTALISCPSVESGKAVWRIVGLTWLMAVWILQSLFGGEMFTAMAMPPELNVIDNFFDLATKSTSKITVLENSDSTPEVYLTKARLPFKERLVKRIEITDLIFIYDEDTIEGILKGIVEKGETLLNFHYALEQYVNNMFDGRYRDRVYISKEGGNLAYLFDGQLSQESFPFRVRLCVSIRRMTETGIYGKWVTIYENKQEPPPTPIADYEQGILKHFTGLFILCGASWALAMVVCTLEVGVFELKNAWTRRRVSNIVSPAKPRDAPMKTEDCDGTNELKFGELARNLMAKRLSFVIVDN